MALNLVSPLVVLALLTDRVVPSRSTQLQAYRIYLELLKRNMFTIKDHISGSHYEKRIIHGTVLNNYRICLMRCFKETLGHSLHHLAPLQILLPLVVLYLIQMISGHRSRQVQWGLIMILSDLTQELIMPSR